MGITDTIARIRTGLGEDSPHIADLKELESGINTVKQTLSDQNRVLDDAKRHLTSANNESKERRLANETLEKERDEFKNKLDKFETEFPSMKKELEEYQSYKTSQLDSARTRWNERLGMIPETASDDVKGAFRTASDGETLSDEDVSFNNSKFKEYEKLNIFKVQKPTSNIKTNIPGSSSDGPLTRDQIKKFTPRERKANHARITEFYRTS
ncbi:MAG: hypothetical protein HN641_13470 [Candidatus Marinimicrobia bacterium]|jgi:predicted nuclease with TOPRIM domain|nr:hypothetical protein [Candidatus Neomarinimicrobiota bacterium]